MTTEPDCIVIGGGVAGLGVAGKLAGKGYSVVVLEEDGRVGLPKHCTGLVSSKTLSNLGRPARESVIRRFDHYIIKSADGSELILRFGTSVYLLERVKLEELMLAEAEALGARVMLKRRVEGLRRVPSGFAIYTAHGAMKCRSVAVCEGAKRLLTRALGLTKRINNLLGIQAVTVCNDPPPTVVVYAEPLVSRRFFGWFVPLDNKRTLVGLADSLSVGGAEIRRRLDRMLRIATREFGCREVEEIFGGLMPADRPLYPIAYPNMLLVGDSASMVKPLTGGGLYVISSITSELEHVDLSDLEVLNQRTRSLIGRLRRQYLLAKTARSLGYFRLVRIAKLLLGDELFIKDYDSPHAVFSALLKRF